MDVFIATSSFGEYNPEPLKLLNDRGFNLKMNPFGRPLGESDIAELAGDCVGIIAGTEPYARNNLLRLRRLRVISRCGVGLDGIDLDEAARIGISVLFTPQGPTQAVAELTLGLILSLVRHIEISSTQLKRGRWQKQMGLLLQELRIGIIGLGRIGRRVAGLLKTLDADILACDIEPDYGWAEKNKVPFVTLEELMRSSDVVCLHVPYSKEVHHLIGENELKMMKAGSYLVNPSRGGLVDENALYRALASGQLRGAALDTFEREPYEGPLRELDNAILTPHIGSYARAGRIQMEMEAAQNMIRELERLGVTNNSGTARQGD